MEATTTTTTATEETPKKAKVLDAQSLAEDALDVASAGAGAGGVQDAPEGLGRPDAATAFLRADAATTEEGGAGAAAAATATAPAPRDPRREELERLLAELPQDEIVVVATGAPMGGAAASTTADADGTGAAAATGDAGGAAASAAPALPAFRFSATTAALGARTTPEQEEALRVTGVNGQNYARILNPQGFIPGRRKNAFEIDLDDIDHPKWREPGAVQSDFFNFGLTEQTWREYAARQVALRLFRQQKLAEEEARRAASGGRARASSNSDEYDY